MASQQRKSGQIVGFIRDRYAAEYHATAAVGYERFLSQLREAGQGAALGYRRATEGPLFLERYLDQPVEQALAPHYGPGLARARIVEIGSLAGNSCMALFRLWTDTAQALGSEADVGVAVLTASLRSMFARLGIPVHVLAAADPARLGPAAGQWGTYYAHDPQVCAGSLAEGLARLQAFSARRRVREPVR